MIRCRKAGQSKELHGGEQEGDFVPRHYFFEEINEAASVLAECADAIGPGDLLPYAEEVMNDRINKLLDMYLLAKTLEDEEWMSELQERLKQISGFSFYPDRVKIS
ncbi:methyltransferase [Paenibacillus dendritiformis]|nr:methyltransferase [Paenibacillus dendritiformis]NRF99342.1 methyltransferase [Paenibacillus dendritiformis]